MGEESKENKIDEVKFFEQPMWCWECPGCGHFNEDCNDLNYEDVVVCEECYKEYQPKPE